MVVERCLLSLLVEQEADRQRCQLVEQLVEQEAGRQRCLLVDQEVAEARVVLERCLLLTSCCRWRCLLQDENLSVLLPHCRRCGSACGWTDQHLLEFFCVPDS